MIAKSTAIVYFYYMTFIFDIGGVVTNSAAIYPLIAQKLHMTTEQLIQFCSASDYDIALALTKGKIDVTEFWRIFSERSHIDVQENYWRTLFHPVQNKAVYDIITRLQKKYRVVTGTNTIQDHYDTHMKHHDYDIFNKVYASQLMHEAKPELDFWKYILNAEQLAPSDAFFIDDTQENIDAAGSLGIHTHHFIDAAHLEEAVAQWL